MILYHFTGLEHLDAIMKDGLSIGDVPTSSTEGKTGVWFTTDQDPAGHGLGVEMDLPNGGRIPNKRAVRITVSIPSSDRKLVSWMKWGRKHCNPDMFDRLNRSGGGKCKSWYIYFSTVKPDQFSNIEILTSTPPRVVFAQLPDAHCSELRTIAPSLNLRWRAETYPCGQNIGLRLLSLRSRIRSR